MRKLAFLVAPVTVGALMGLAPGVAAAQTQPTPDATAFCDAGLKVDKAFAAAGESNKPPTKKQQQAIEQSLTQALNVAPSEVAADVQSIQGIIQSALQGKQDPSENPTFLQNLSSINGYRYSSCGYNQVQVTGIEYEFQGLPKTLPAGKTAIQFTDAGEAVLNDGTYTDTLPCLADEGWIQGCVNGRIRVRASDGVHFATSGSGYSAGGRRFADAIDSAIRKLG